MLGDDTFLLESVLSFCLRLIEALCINIHKIMYIYT